MHSIISITDGIYGMLSNFDKKELLANFDYKTNTIPKDVNQKPDEIILLLKQNNVAL